MSQGDEFELQREARLRTRNESREPRAIQMML